MTSYSKYNLIYRLQRWLDSVPGQTFLNYAYSWGASIVILGTLFKLTHLPGANVMLYLGMGTEVFVFFISAFDRPFDKTSIGKDIPTHVTEDEMEEGEREIEEAEEEGVSPMEAVEQVMNTQPVGYAQPVHRAASVGGGAVSAAPQAPVAAASADNAATGDSLASAPAAVASQPDAVASAPQGATAAPQVVTAYVPQAPQLSSEMEEATQNYVEELKKLTEMLGKVSDQSARLTRDSEEMENLNRTLTGICKVYEMQLKGASAQIGTIDQINDQSRKMAEQIEQLNKIYARMIEAMTVNMRAAAPNSVNTENK